MKLNIWPWSKIRELREICEFQSQYLRYLKARKRELQRELADSVAISQKFLDELQLKQFECNYMKLYLTLSPYERKRRRHDIRRHLPIWYNEVEVATHEDNRT